MLIGASAPADAAPDRPPRRHLERPRHPGGGRRRQRPTRRASAAEIGRDPARDHARRQPGLNLLASVDDFVDGVAAYRAVGFTDFQIPWPRTEAELPVMRAVARDIIPQLRRS